MNKIPKIIHYCWFGDNMFPSLVLKCIESWKRYCPDYIIKEWNESNFDINFNEYTKEAYKSRKWAFVSDVARLYAVYTEGGIYLDTDVELIKPIDYLLNDSMFIGFETDKLIATGLGFGAEKSFNIIKKMLNVYDNISFTNKNGTVNIIPCPIYNTAIMRQEGFIINNTLQRKNNITVYPTEYFCPKDVKTGITNITNNTYMIHHFDASWKTFEQKKEYEIMTGYRKRYGNRLGIILYTITAICTLRKSGINNIIDKIKKGTKI